MFKGKKRDRYVLKNIYVGFIRSVLDYRSIIYELGPKSLLNGLDSIQYQVLRWCCVLQVEMGEMALVRPI